MITIGAREAGVKPALLDKVRNGEEVVITRQGKAVARLVATEIVMRPRTPEEQAEIDEAFREMEKLRKEMNLRDLDWKALRDEGRR